MVKLSLDADNMILHLESSKNSTLKLLDLIKEFCRVARLTLIHCLHFFTLTMKYYKGDVKGNTFENCLRTSLVVQWLQFCTPNVEGPGSNPSQGTRYQKPPLRVHMPLLKSPHAAIRIEDPMCPAKSQHSQINT